MNSPGGDPPSSIAAIMAAIGREVAGDRAAAPPVDVSPADMSFAEVSPAGLPPAELPVAPVAPVARSGATDATVVTLPPLDDALRVALTPLLRAWLDAHLPEIVETAVHAEIRRLTGQV